MGHSSPCRTVRLGLLLLPLLFLAIGCDGGKESIVSVSGKVTVKDKPVTKGSIAFYADESKGNKTSQVPVGQLGTDGTYTLECAAGSGAPVGWYKVTVNATVPSNPKDEYSTPKHLVNQKYADMKSTPLSVEVKQGAAAADYEFKIDP